MLKDELDRATLPGRTLPSQRGLSCEVLIDVLPLAAPTPDDEERPDDCRRAWLTGAAPAEPARGACLFDHPFASGILIPAVHKFKSQKIPNIDGQIFNQIVKGP